MYLFDRFFLRYCRIFNLFFLITLLLHNKSNEFAIKFTNKREDLIIYDLCHYKQTINHVLSCTISMIYATKEIKTYVS